MPTIRGSASLAAGATVNILQGNQYEFLRSPHRFKFPSATSGSWARLSGSDVLMQQAPVSVKAAARFSTRMTSSWTTLPPQVSG